MSCDEIHYIRSLCFDKALLMQEVFSRMYQRYSSNYITKKEPKSNARLSKFSGCSPEKNWVDFTGHPSNFSQGAD